MITVSGLSLSCSWTALSDNNDNINIILGFQLNNLLLSGYKNSKLSVWYICTYQFERMYLQKEAKPNL